MIITWLILVANDNHYAYTGGKGLSLGLYWWQILRPITYDASMERI
jgi:hypothetical protein